LPKLFGERILNKLRQNFGTNDIPFGLLTFGQIVGIVKTEGLNLYTGIKLQAKYESEKAQSRKEMSNFCDAFGITKLEAPSAATRRAQKKQIRPSYRKPAKPSPPFIRKENSKPPPQRKTPIKKKKNCVLQMWKIWL